MRNFFGILVLVFFTTNVFGQKFIRDWSFVQSTPTGNNTIEDAIHRRNIIGDNYDWIDYIHFVKNEKLFILSYEPKEDPMDGGSRDIYLYSKDINDINSPWKKASQVIMTNSYDSYNVLLGREGT